MPSSAEMCDGVNTVVSPATYEVSLQNHPLQHGSCSMFYTELLVVRIPRVATVCSTATGHCVPGDIADRCSAQLVFTCLRSQSLVPGIIPLLQLVIIIVL